MRGSKAAETAKIWQLGGRLVVSRTAAGLKNHLRAPRRCRPAKNPVSVCGRGLPPPIDPEIHPNRPRKQETKCMQDAVDHHMHAWAAELPRGAILVNVFANTSR
jgi:hypothetical protein